MTDEQFCRIETSFSGEEIDKVEQLAMRQFTGRELKEYLEHAIATLYGSNESKVNPIRRKTDRIEPSGFP